jgi:hypothetical protein
MLAVADPSPHLKDVKIVRYQLSVEPPNTARCAIDLKAWNTAIDFVANQSPKLALMRDADHFEQDKQLRDEAKKASENYWQRHLGDAQAKKEADDAGDKAMKFLYAPSLLLSIHTMDMNVGCAGTVSATVRVGLEPTKIIATGNIAYQPYVTVWSEDWLIKGPYATFPSIAVQTSEQILKAFVNDWARSQEY